jgi:hypothetical protein
MRIDKENYEVWFLDFFEGRLSPEEKQELQLFLMKNPELEQEFDQYEYFTLTSEKITFPAKQNLKRPLREEIPPAYESADDFLIAHTEGLLSATGNKVLDNLLEKYPLLEKDLRYFKKSKLSPDKRITFPYKESLKKEIFPATINLRRSVIYALSAAASIAVVFLWLILNQAPDDILIIQNTQRSEESAPKQKPVFSKEYPAEKENMNEIHADANPVLAEKKIVEKDKPEPYAASKKIGLNGGQAVLTASIAAIPVNIDPELPYKTESMVETRNTRNASMRMDAFLLSVFRKSILKKENLPEKEQKFSVWELAEAGLQGINKLTGSEMDIKKTYDTSGNVAALAFESRSLSFSTRIK